MRVTTLFAAALLLGAAGCANQDLGTKGGATSTAADDLKRIDENPNMPPQAKAAAKAQIEARMGQLAPSGR